MKFRNIKIKNFRQYQNAEIDLSTTEHKNIVIVGGKTGYGKTNFLISIVWCLYGDKLTKIDENFRHEIQKDQNYFNFMKRSLNRDSQIDGKREFSVELIVEGLDLPNNLNYLNGSAVVRRQYNTDKCDELLFIKSIEGVDIFEDTEDKINFIYDYIIPHEAAKFVLFDAEKISSWAELSTKEEGNVLNDALGKLIGLDVYENLKEDLILYTNNLKKECAESNIKEQIINVENSILLSQNRIEQNELKIAEKDSEILDYKQKLTRCDTFIKASNKTESTIYNRDALIKEIQELENKQIVLENKFSDFSELCPLVILSGKLEEVQEQLNNQENFELNKDVNIDIKDKLDDFIEKLFNLPPDPESMSFKNKIFYSEKAQVLLNELFEVEDLADLDFELDITHSDKDLITKTIEIIHKQSADLFESIIEEFNYVQDNLSRKKHKLALSEANVEDETLSEAFCNKVEIEREKDKAIIIKGGLYSEIENIKTQINRDNNRKTQLLKEIKGSEIVEKKLLIAYNSIKALQDFIDSQKQSRKESLADSLLQEMKLIMHKFNTPGDDFISEVKIDILLDGKGLKVSFFNDNGINIPKESFSAGEKQIYIYCLIKAILREAVQEYPIFIDTPLGRLDHEHIENVLNKYYPELSSQVVLLATNNEITPKRYRNIIDKVSKSYLIVHENNKSTFKSGYFNNYEN